MVEMLGLDPGKDGMPSDALYIARMLLVMAGIPPGTEPYSEGDQYSIDSFKISVDKIEIRNHGIVNRLKVQDQDNGEQE